MVDDSPGAATRRGKELPLPAATQQWRMFPLAVILVGIVVIAYFPTLHNMYAWDDDTNVWLNSALTSLSGLRDIWLRPSATQQYYPLSYTTFWTEYHIWGTVPMGYHAVNVLLHAAGAVLLWRLLRRLSVPGAWLAAAIFALHPVHVESVAWISERKNVLSGVFYLSAALVYLRFSGVSEAPPRSTATKRSYALALVLFACALLSKTVTCTLPAAILLVLWWKRGRPLRSSDVIPLVPFFALGVAGGAVTALLERVQVGAVGPDFAFSFPQRLLLAGRAVWFYLGKLLWPDPLILIYPKWQLDTTNIFQFGYPLAVALLAIALWLLRHRLGKAPLVAFLFFCGTLLPALGFFNVNLMKHTFVADHFQYLASVGPIALFAAAMTALFRAASGQRTSIAVRVSAGALLSGLAFMTWRQTHIYRTEETLYLHTVSLNPSAWVAMNNLGLIYVGRGEVERGLRYLDRAHALKPSVIAPEFLASLHNIVRPKPGAGPVPTIVQKRPTEYRPSR